MRILDTERLSLRWLDLGDAAFIRRLVNEPSWLRYIGDRGVRTDDDARRYLEKGPLAMYAGSGFGLYLVETRSTREPIGMCGFVKRETLPDVDLGFAFLPEYWGRGYAFEAAAATMAFGGSTLGLKRVVAITAQDNRASIRLLERLGFRFERLLRLGDDAEELCLYAAADSSPAASREFMTATSRPPEPQAAVEVLPLNAARLADFLEFFDGDAFADNPKWASCYCQCFYEDHSKVRWASRTAAENRAAACRRIGEGAMQGFLAYRDGRVIGWCNAAPRPLLHALDPEPIPDGAVAGTILCFLVTPAARGGGVATALLRGACAAMRAQGMHFVDANPRPGATGTGENHYGPLSMYLAAGFSIQRTDDDGSVWVRLAL
jgi:RimJ/RimL family protein N-acetyltransferase